MLARLPRASKAAGAAHAALRHCSEGKLEASADDVAELLEGTLDQSRRGKREDGRPRLLTTRREALSLYREVLRCSHLFTWRDERGRLWRDVIRESARSEFEAARGETDPELLTRMIITGRDAVRKAVEQFAAKRAALQQQQQQGDAAPPWGGPLP